METAGAVEKPKNGFPTAPWTFGPQFPQRRLRLTLSQTQLSFYSLPRGLKQFQRRAPELALLIREAFLRGLSTRQVGRVVSTLSGEVVSAQTVSRLIRDLDDAVRQFHQAGTCQESCV